MPLTKEDPLYVFERWAKDKPRAELGGLLKEYIAESNHNGWDGHARRDLTGIRHFLDDLMLYHDSVDEPSKFATKLSNVNPVS